MNILYTARRSLIAGHVAGNQYTLVIATTTRQQSRSVEKVQQKSLSGRLETLWFYGERTWSITFEPVAGANVPALREFLDSTESGEPFSMSLFGELDPAGKPLAAVTVKRTDSGYTLTLFMDTGDLDSDSFTTTIEVLEQ